MSTCTKLERVCLDLFYASEVDRITCTCYCQCSTMWTLPELIEVRAAAVPNLPKCLVEIWLDVTPAPAATRKQHHLILNQFVRDKCASQRFLGGHVQEVAALLRRIDEYYCERTRIILTGRLSTNGTSFVDLVSVGAGNGLEFVRKWVSNDEARFVSINQAVQRMTSGSGCGRASSVVESIP